MKRAIYSYAAKTIAFILLVASAAFGSYKTVDLLTDISTDYETYRFESNFYESNAFDRTLLQPFIMMLNMEDYYEDNFLHKIVLSKD